MAARSCSTPSANSPSTSLEPCQGRPAHSRGSDILVATGQCRSGQGQSLIPVRTFPTDTRYIRKLVAPAGTVLSERNCLRRVSASMSRRNASSHEPRVLATLIPRITHQQSSAVGHVIAQLVVAGRPAGHSHPRSPSIARSSPAHRHRVAGRFRPVSPACDPSGTSPQISESEGAPFPA